MEKKTQSVTKKIRLNIVGDKDEKERVFEYLKKGIESQVKAMNYYISSLYASFILDLTNEDRIEMKRLFSRMSDSKLENPYDKEEFKFAKGLGSPSSLTKAVNSDFKTAMKKGLLYGNISLPSYRKTYPLLIHNSHITLKSISPCKQGMYHKYSNHNDFLDALFNEKDINLYIDFANNIQFKMILGNLKKSWSVRKVIQKIFEEEYTIGDSKIQVDGNSAEKANIYLLLSVAKPVQKKKLLEENTIAVIFGKDYPVLCLANNKKRTYHIGDIEIVQDYKKQNTENYNRLKKQQGVIRGGRGYNHKFYPKLLDFDKKLRNYANNYNHKLSKEIVDYAIDNRAKTIYIESSTLLKYERLRNSKFLGDWSYYQIISDVIYKANLCGITVVECESLSMWKRCSVCGKELDENNMCTNEACENKGKVNDLEKNALKYLLDYTRLKELENKEKKKRDKKKA